MTTETILPADQPVILMTRLLPAPRDLVWEAMTKVEHVGQWWGGHYFSVSECTMDFRVGGEWKLVLNAPDGTQFPIFAVYLDIAPPGRLVWRNYVQGDPAHVPPPVVNDVTLEAIGDTTRWSLVATFDSLEARDASVKMGFADMISQSTDRLIEYVGGM